MNWCPQIPIDLLWDELDGKARSRQPRNVQHFRNFVMRVKNEDINERKAIN